MPLAESSRYKLHQPVVSTDTFLVTFPIFSTEDLRVVVDGVDTLAFSVTATFVSGTSTDAAIVLVDAVTDVDVEIYGSRAARAESDYIGNSPNLAVQIQLDTERTTAVQQEQARDFTRSLKLPSNATQSKEIAPPTGPNQILSSNSDNTGFQFEGTTTGDVANAAANAAAAASSATEAALYDGPWLDNVAALLDDETLTYTAGQNGTVVAGDIIRTRAEGFAYEVAASAATDHHVTTEGGVKLYVLAGVGGYNIKAFGANGIKANDEAAFGAAIDMANSIGSTGSSGRETTQITIYIPDGEYDLTSGLPAKSIDVDNVTFVGESPDGTIIKVTSGSLFRWGQVMATGRAFGGGVRRMKFLGVNANDTSLLFDLGRTAHLSFSDIGLRDVGSVIKAGDLATTKLSTSVFVSAARGWTANLGVPTFDLQEGAGFTLDESCYIYTNIGTPSQIDGTHDGAENAATLSDSTASFGAVDALVGGVVRNITDGSIGTITANTATTVTATLSGGTENDWDASDVYQIQEPHEALSGQHFINCEGNWDTVQAIGARCNRYYRPINCAPATGLNANNWFITNFVGDYSAQGMRWNSTGGNIRNHRIDGGWSFALMGNSVTLEGSGLGLLEHVHFNGVQVMLSGVHGFDISKGEHCSVVGCTTQGQGRMAAASGVRISGLARNVTVRGGTHGLNSSATTPYDAQAAIGVETTADARRLTIVDVRAGGTVADFSIATPSTQPKASAIRGNYNISGGDAGYVAANSGAITVPASTVPYINATPFEIRYYISAGVATNVRKNGVRHANDTNVMLVLRPGENLDVTYSSVPGIIAEVIN